MELGEIQKQKVGEWVAAGATPSEVQNRLAEEFEIRLTYMEIRFLLDDLKLELKDREPEKSAENVSPEADPGSAMAEEDGLMPGEDAADGGEPGGSGVSVSVDRVTRPGAVVSGKVTFSDGKAAEWYLDQMGRLGLAPQEQGYRPSESDVMAFQTELQNQLSRHGL